MTSPAKKKWARLIEDNTIHLGGNEYISIRVLQSLEKLFDQETSVRARPELIIENFNEWKMMTKNLIEDLHLVSEAMGETSKGIHAKTCAEYQAELLKCPPKSP